MKKLSDYSVKFEKKRSNKLFSVMVTSLVIGLLFFLGPVNAFNLQIDGLRNTSYQMGEEISFIARVDIEPNEVIPIKNLSLIVNDQNVCTFTVHGQKLTDCTDINIDLIFNSAAYGYGYGYWYFQQSWSGNNFSTGAGFYNGTGEARELYGYGMWNPGDELTYEITIHTPQEYLSYGGFNRIKIITNTGAQILNSREHIISIDPVVAGNGEFMFGTDDFGATFYGLFDSSSRTLAGTVNWTNTPFVMTGVGTYNPYSNNSGEFEIRFYDPNNRQDPGLVWVGTYDENRWSMNYTGNMAISFNGPSYIVPQP